MSYEAQGLTGKVLSLFEKMRRRPQPEPIDVLESYTGKDATYWVEAIQQKIQSTWQPNPDDANHPIQENPVDDWIAPIASEALERMMRKARAEGRVGDENIGCAYVVATILATWSLRIGHAKSFDPRRPLEHRKPSYTTWRAMVLQLLSLVLDESRDEIFFPQPFESPWLKDATDGDFR